MIPFIEQTIVIPKQYRISSIAGNEAEFLHDFITKHAVKKTLEIGLGFGYSAAYIMHATGARHRVIDPFQKRYRYLGLFNLDRLGFRTRLTFYGDYSHFVLPALSKAGETFQFIFIDGGHRFDEIFLDFYFSDLMLETNGYIVFHDATYESTQFVLSWIRKNRTDYVFVPIDMPNMVIIMKRSEKPVFISHLVDFYPWKYKIKSLLSKIGSLLPGRTASAYENSDLLP